MPQQVCPSGNSTVTPRRRRSLTMATPTSGKNRSPRQVIMTEAFTDRARGVAAEQLGGGLRPPSGTSPQDAVRAAGRPRAGPRACEASDPEFAPAKPALEPRARRASLSPTSLASLIRTVGWRRRDDHEDEERLRAIVDEAVLDPGRGHQRLAGAHPFLLAAQREAPATLQHVVDLVLGVVGMRLLRLPRRDAVEVELAPVGRGERDLRHLVRGEPGEVLDADLHASPSARASSDTGCPTSISSAWARQCRAICMRHPGLPAATMRAPVSSIRSTFRSPSSAAMRGSRRL